MPDEKHSGLDHLVDALLKVSDLAREQKLQAAIIGGVAASLRGRPRFTRDVDVLLWLDESRWADFVIAAQQYDLLPRKPDALEFAQAHRVLLLRHQSSAIDVDVTFGAIAFEGDVIRRSTLVQTHGLSLPVATPEDLVVMKWIAHRDRDLSDIQGILDARPELDTKPIRRTLADFAELISEFDVLGEFDAMLVRRKSRG